MPTRLTSINVEMNRDDNAVNPYFGKNRNDADYFDSWRSSLHGHRREQRDIRPLAR
jgi:hypothetical protein